MLPPTDGSASVRSNRDTTTPQEVVRKPIRTGSDPRVRAHHPWFRAARTIRTIPLTHYQQEVEASADRFQRDRCSNPSSTRNPIRRDCPATGAWATRLDGRLTALVRLLRARVRWWGGRVEPEILDAHLKRTTRASDLLAD